MLACRIMLVKSLFTVSNLIAATCRSLVDLLSLNLVVIMLKIVVTKDNDRRCRVV